jgi:uncharacterized protein
MVNSSPSGGSVIEADIQTAPKSDIFRPVAAPWHTGMVLAVIAVLAFRGKLQAEQMRAGLNLDRVTLYERTILSEWLVLGLVLAGLRLNGSSPVLVLGDRWRSARQFLRDAGIALLFLMGSIMVTSIVVPHRAAADSVTRFLLPHGGVETALWVMLSITAGICEEAVYRGYLQKQLMALTKSVPAGIIFSALVFGGAHSYQGFARASLIAGLGVMSGVLAYWCRSVRPGMIAHALQDVLGGFV